MFRASLVSTVLLAVFLMPSVSHAQALGIGAGGYLKTTPTYPLPDSVVSVSLELYSVDMEGATVRWYTDGVARGDANDARDIIVPTGNLGSKTNVRAVVTLQNGTVIPVEGTIAPSELDLIVEASTRTPAFYQGRPLPAPDEAVSVTAIPHVAGNPDPASLTYTWTLGSTVLFGGPVRGKTRATFTMPKRQTQLLVTATNASGAVVAGNLVRLQSADPEVYFYEDNPLRGLSERAVSDTFTLIGDETTVNAEPYFVARDIFNKDPIVHWTIDGTPANYGTDPRSITLRATGGGGDARVGFDLMNRQAFLQSVRDSFTIHFE